MNLIDTQIHDAQQRLRAALSRDVARHMSEQFKGRLPRGCLRMLTSLKDVSMEAPTLTARGVEVLWAGRSREAVLRATAEYIAEHHMPLGRVANLERFGLAGTWYLKRIDLHPADWLENVVTAEFVEAGA